MSFWFWFFAFGATTGLGFTFGYSWKHYDMLDRGYQNGWNDAIATARDLVRDSDPRRTRG